MADYPISNVSRRIVYTGSAGVGPYAFNFEVLLNTDIKVYKNDVLLTLTTDYTVSISSTLGTGSVTLVSAATGSDRITIVGARPVERTTDFTTGGDFFANSMNDELDSQTILVQQVAETAERSIKAPVTDPTNINMTLPINTVRAGKTLAFDASGNPVAGDPIGVWRGNWDDGVSYQNRDLVKDTTNDNVYLCTVPHTSSGSLPISTNADSAKWALVVDAAAAGEARIAAEAAQAAAELAETNAETAETNAETAETNAETAATNAASSASAASSSASSASSSASSASSSASAASTSATNAASSASAASTSASNASSSASSASSSASTATTQATNASNSASAASTSATNASNSASAASTSASNASTSATNAASSASSASTSATAASTSASSAAASAAAAAASYDSFDDRYLGAKSSAPSTDNDGNALVTGALYYNTTTGKMNVWDGGTWIEASAASQAILVVYQFTATNGQTTFSGTDNNSLTLGYTVGSAIVTLNGVVMEIGSEVTASSGSSIVLASAASAGDELNVYAFSTFNVANVYTQSQADAVARGYTGFKNRIINGAMVIDQRATSITTGAYSVDRWIYSDSVASKATIAQNTTAPTGFVKSLLVTSSSSYSVGSTDSFTIGQKIEGLNIADLDWGTASAATVTLSFWVRSSLTGTFGGSIRNSAANRSYPFTYTISSANTFEQKTITIAGDTTGTWLTTNGIGMWVMFGLGVGTTYSGTAGSWAGANYTSATGATSVVGTNGATFYITGVQLEKGTTASSFDYRPYGTELALCQRYFQSVGNGTSTIFYGFPGNASSNFRILQVVYPVPMRASATMTYTAFNGSYSTFNQDATFFNALSNAGNTTSDNNIYKYTASAEL